MADESVGQVSVEVVPDATGFGKEAEAKLKTQHIDGVDVDLIPVLNANLAKLNTQMATIAKSLEKKVSLHVDVDRDPLRRLVLPVAALSGFTALQDSIRESRKLLFSLFTDLPSLGAITLGLLSLSGALLSSVANTASLVGSFVQALPILLAIPGIAIGFTVMALALKDLGKELPGVVQQFKQIQPMVSAAFWEGARAPLQELANVLMPQLQKGMTDTATVLGTFAAKFAAEFTNLPLAAWFDQLAASVGIFGEHLPALSQIFTILGNIGAGLLPLLAEYMGQLADRFAGFLNNVAGATQLQSFLEQTMAAFKGIVEFGTGVADAFSVIFAAASASGAATFQSLGDSFHNFAADLRKPENFAALTALFDGAQDMFSNFTKQAGPALAEFAHNLSSGLAPILPQVGDILGRLAAGFSTVFNSESFGGLSDFIDGISRAVPGLITAMGPIAGIIGSLGAPLGELAAIVGKVFAGLQPGMTQILTSLTPIINLLGNGLAEVVTKLSPLLTQVGNSLASIFANPAIQEALSGIIQALVDLVSTVVPPLMTFIQGLVPLITQILQIVAPIISNILQALAPILVSIVEAATPILDLITKLLGWLEPVLIPVLSVLAKIIAESLQWAIEGVIKVIRGFLEVITGVIDFIVGVFTGDWERAWDGIKAIFKGVVDIIVGIVQFIFGTAEGGSIYGIIKGGLKSIKSFWDDIWNGIIKFFKQSTDDIWKQAVKFVNDVFSTLKGWGDNVVGFFKGLWDKAAGLVSDMWNAIKTRFVSAGGDVTKVVSDLVTDVLKFIGELPKKIGDIFLTASTWLYQAGINIVTGLINGVKSLAGTIGTWFLNQLPGWIVGPFKAALGIFSPSKVFHGFGENIVEGLVGGLESRQVLVERAMGRMSDGISATQFNLPSITGGGFASVAAQIAAGATASRQFNYYAAPNNSIDSEEDLFVAIGRARGFGGF